jgi:DNA polymerase-4
MKERLIFHIDMNSFFASCEQVIQPELKGKAIAVVGDVSKRSGIVLAASYEAKAYGVRTTMPIYQALKCCKNLILVSSTYGLYSDMSHKVMELFDLYTPLKEQLSIDEAFLDMTGTEYLFGDPLTAAKTIQNHILNELDLACSIGISTNKLLSKMASDMKKPLGITTLFPAEVEMKLWPLPVGQLYGIGKKTVAKLNTMGIHTIKDLALADAKHLYENFGEKSGNYMKQSAMGMSQDQLKESASIQVKSVGNELTYSKDLISETDIKNEILLLADTVGYRLRHKMLKGRTLQVKIKFNDFTLITRSKSFTMTTDSTDFIFKEAWELIDANKGSKPIRLLGISLSNFELDKDNQLSLFEQVEETKKVDKMVDEIRDKFGYKAINRAVILDKKHGKM